MSATTVGSTFFRAIKPEFAESLFANFEQALAGCYLSEEEITQLNTASLMREAKPKYGSKIPNRNESVLKIRK